MYLLERQRDNYRNRNLLLTVSFFKCPEQPDLGQAKVKIPQLKLESPTGRDPSIQIKSSPAASQDIYCH